jgi:hypothetical protein
MACGESSATLADGALDSGLGESRIGDSRVTGFDGTSDALDLARPDPLAFRPPLVIATTSGNSKSPVIAAMPDGALHVIWHDFSTNPANLWHGRKQGGGWSAKELALIPEKSIFADVVADQGAGLLHLVWQATTASGNVIYHATSDGTAFGAVEALSPGERVSATIDREQRLHLAFFQKTKDQAHPLHQVRTDSGWSPSINVPFDHTYLNTLRLKLLSTRDGVELALSSSAGGTSYDIQHYLWTADTGWSPRRVLYGSFGLSSDDVDGAVDAAGKAHWVWTEQDPLDPWTIGVVEQSSDEESPTWVMTSAGSALVSPSIVVPPDGQSLVFWVAPDETIGVARRPYGQAPIGIGSPAANGPRATLDAEGYCHLVYYGADASGVEQIWYSSNRPDP